MEYQIIADGACDLYGLQFEHDNCGIGAVVSIKGVKTHQTVSDALSMAPSIEQKSAFKKPYTLVASCFTRL